MSEEAPEKKIDDAIPTKPEETTPAPESVPPAVTPEPENKLKDIIDELTKKVDDLTELVNGVLNTATPTPDSTPVKLPWTHWGSR
jgi:hypothetical protein